ncbi:DUF418 domain-containing protein [Saccharibacillus alkalitolerans]|uniref:DUF418 domain-containing protein n=1 Tax=Saccharibacillus alkalitolerans TaxID=2705290 RepID=A0ABX0F432_9BACL|nr:DUF418 domain-containing protein [Saccharibacillus alkalitolerans]NGZ74388.1 DUF418 domain-containing protein [Saccharibacillus alkalitolerans]
MTYDTAAEESSGKEGSGSEASARAESSRKTPRLKAGAGTPAGRIDVLDQLRGVALFAIFLCNLMHLTGASLDEADAAGNFLQKAIDIVFGNSARPLFSFMFGISMMLIFDAAVRRGRRPYPMLLRRMVLLLLFGALHVFAVWDGDILFMYALDGFMLLLFLWMPKPLLLLSGILLFFVSSYEIQAAMPSWLASRIQAMTPATWLYEGVTRLPNPDVFFSNSYVTTSFGELVLATEHLTFFLFGMYAYRSGLFVRLPKHPRLAAALGAALLLIGWSGKYAYSGGAENAWITTLHPAACFAVTIGAVLLVVGLAGVEGSPGSRLLEPFRAVGRMAFTNYLMQSLVFVTLFKASGEGIFASFGVIGSLPLTAVVPIGIVFFALQMTFSHYWLRSFRYGPFEWLWRAGTNLELPPFKKRALSGKDAESRQSA